MPHHVPNRVTVPVSREVDMATAPAVALDVEVALARMEPGSELALDLGGVTFTDSSGLAVLVEARRDSTAADCSLVLTDVPEQVHRLLEITRLDTVFRLERGIT